jgi:hypothetical protein
MGRGKRLAHRLIVTSVLLGALGGCVRYYWSRPGSTPEQFAKDSLECAREAAPTPAARQFGIVTESAYRACLSAHGYTRDKQAEPPPPGFYRGIE